jgi:hypothetical protein
MLKYNGQGTNSTKDTIITYVLSPGTPSQIKQKLLDLKGERYSISIIVGSFHRLLDLWTDQTKNQQSDIRVQQYYRLNEPKRHSQNISYNMKCSLD